jgi:DNA polymerase-1
MTATPRPRSNRGQLRNRLTWPQFDAWLAKIEAAELTALDTETTSLDSFAARIVGISLSVTPGEACYIPLAHTAPGVADQLPRDEVLARLKPWLEAADRRKGAAKRQVRPARFRQPRHRAGRHRPRHHAASYVIESDKGHDLGQLCSRHLGLATIAYEDLCGKGAKQITFDQVDIERAATYAAEDADVTLRVHDVLHPQFANEPGLSRIYHDIEMPARQVIWQIERNGILVDADSAGPPEPRNGPEDHGPRSPGLRTGRPAFQPGLAQATGRHPVQKSSACRSRRKRRPAARPPTRKCFPNWRSTTRCPSCCSNTAACPN